MPRGFLIAFPGLVTVALLLWIAGFACRESWAIPFAAKPQVADATVHSLRGETLLPRRDTRRIGEWQAGSSLTSPPVMGGQAFPHALVVGPFDRKPDTAAELRIRLEGAFDRFTVTVGRDDKTTESGPAYAVFEVWGDDKLLVRSLALRSDQHPVTITGIRSSARRAPQPLDTPVSGVRVLRLVTRYASELEQEVPLDAKVSGCLWVEPLLVPSVAAAVRPVRVPVTPPTDDVRTVLRGLVVQVAAQAAAVQADMTPPKLPPFTVFVGPVTVTEGKKPDRLPVSETQLRTMLMQMLVGVRRGSTLIFGAPSGRLREPKAKPDDEVRWREAARTAKAFFLVRTFLSPPSTAESEKPEGKWQIEVRLIEAESGRQDGAARAFLTGGR